MNKYELQEAIEILRKNGVGFNGKRITVKSGTLGLKRLGMVDYLVNIHKYSVIWIGW